MIPMICLPHWPSSRC